MERELLQELLPHGNSCLELGGGFGRITPYLEPYFVNTLMVDYSRAMLGKAKTRTHEATLLRTDLRTLPFRDDSFDCVLAVRVLHHIEDLQGLIGEIARVCRDGACVIFGVPHPRLGFYKGAREGQRILLGKWNHVAYVRSIPEYSHPLLTLVERRGCGIFDNRVGRRARRFWMLSEIDVLTSRAWMLKSELFLKYRVDK